MRKINVFGDIISPPFEVNEPFHNYKESKLIKEVCPKCGSNTYQTEDPDCSYHKRLGQSALLEEMSKARKIWAENMRKIEAETNPEVKKQIEEEIRLEALRREIEARADAQSKCSHEYLNPINYKVEDKVGPVARCSEYLYECSHCEKKMIIDGGRQDDGFANIDKLFGNKEEAVINFTAMSDLDVANLVLNEEDYARLLFLLSKDEDFQDRASVNHKLIFKEALQLYKDNEVKFHEHVDKRIDEESDKVKDQRKLIWNEIEVLKKKADSLFRDKYKLSDF